MALVETSSCAHTKAVGFVMWEKQEVIYIFLLLLLLKLVLLE